MSDWKSYLIGIISASFFLGIITKLIGEKSSMLPIVKTLSGIIICLAFLSPIIIKPELSKRIQIEQINQNAKEIAELGAYESKTQIDLVIKEKIDSYIFEKAKSMGVELNANSEVKDSNIQSVTLTGSVSPYMKGKLTDWLSESLGINEEAVRWLG